MKPANSIQDKFSQEVGEKAERKLKAQHEIKRNAWSGFGLFGVVGWSVAVPTLAGAALGRWLDAHYPQTFSWTLTFLFIGLLTGCGVALHWINKENDDMHNRQKETK